MTCKRSLQVLVVACGVVAGLTGPAAARAPLRVPIATSTGVDLPHATVAFDYPSGPLSSDFTPPSWTEPARGHPCQAQLVLTAPTMGAAITPLDSVILERGARVSLSRAGRPQRTLALRWMLGRGLLGGLPVLQYSVAIGAPRELSRYGSVIGVGMYGQAAKRGTYDTRCTDPRLERAALARTKAAARRLIRGFDVALAR
jgi:hypothetical protein